VNSIEHEVTPFIAADNKTLYFSTRGFSGFGDNDIFKSTRLDDSWSLWTEPENLGPAVNTANWDGYFTMPASGDFAYICSFSGGAKEDIYKLILPKTAQPNPVAIITGNVLASDGKTAVPATLTMTARSSINKTEVKQYEPTTGVFSFVVPLKDIYDFIPEANGFISVNETIDLSNETSYREINKDFYLIPIEVGSKGILNSFSFEQGEAKLQPSLMKNLDRIVKVMKEIPSLEILFEGHTDNQGDFQLNMKLSEERVTAVKKYIVNQGISPLRITTKGWGPTRPISSNTTEERRRLNRRVEFTITKK
jgi:outer membrane protein OmpA-like peptidoglycan-associated protein